MQSYYEIIHKFIIFTGFFLYLPTQVQLKNEIQII